MPKTTRYTIKDEDGNIVDKSVTDFEPGRVSEKPGVPLQRELLELHQAIAGLDDDDTYPVLVSFWRRLCNQAEMERQQAKRAITNLAIRYDNTRKCLKHTAREQGKIAWICYKCGNVGPLTEKTDAITQRPPEGWDTFELGCPVCKYHEQQGIIALDRAFERTDNG